MAKSFLQCGEAENICSKYWFIGEREREGTERLETGKGEKAFTTLSFKVIIGVGWLDGWLAGWLVHTN